MVEVQWWQAALLGLIPIGAGVIGGIVTAMLTHRLTTSATQRAEMREADRRKSEEERDAIRQLRKERMKPIVEFLELAKQFLAHEAQRTKLEVARQIYANNVGGIADQFPQKEWEKQISSESAGPETELSDVTVAYSIASSTATRATIREALGCGSYSPSCPLG